MWITSAAPAGVRLQSLVGPDTSTDGWMHSTEVSESKQAGNEARCGLREAETCVCWIIELFVDGLQLMCNVVRLKIGIRIQTRAKEMEKCYVHPHCPHVLGRMKTKKKKVKEEEVSV